MKDDIIVLTTTDGEEIEFVEIAGIKLGDKFYLVLQPVELPEGMDDDEALVFEKIDNGDEEQYSIELDDEIIDKVFEEYNRLLEQLDKE